MLLRSLLAVVDTTNVFGTVSPPPGVADFNAQAPKLANGEQGIGLLIFFSNIIKLATIVAGLWVLVNFITAGYIFITASGDSASANKVKDQLTYSVMGLVVIVLAYTLIALISYFLFGKADYILNPVISGPG